METHKLIFHSRTAAESDWECQRKRFYTNVYEGGIVKDNLTVDLFIGTVLHDGLAAIATAHRDTGKVDISTIAGISRKLVFDTIYEYHAQAYTDEKLPENSTEYLHAQEQSTLVEALLRGFYKHQWPALIAEYNIIVASEKEAIFQACATLQARGLTKTKVGSVRILVVILRLGPSRNCPNACSHWQ